MAGKKNNTAIKNSPKHLLGIQSLSIIEAKEILDVEDVIASIILVDDLRIQKD